MPVTPESKLRFETALNAATPVRMKAMFGGYGIYQDEALFALIDDDRLYFKVDDISATEYEAAGCGPWVMYDGKANMKYREVPDAALTDPKKLKGLIDHAVKVAIATAKPKKAKK